MASFKAWISAMRLRTLPLSLSGILLGSSIAYGNGFWDNQIFAFALLTTVLFQILSNFANDLGDSLKGTDNDERIGPTRAVQSGEISIKAMKIAVAITSVFSFISAGVLIYFGSMDMPGSMIWFYGGLAVLAVLAAITYTVGKKAYGYSGLGDLMVLIFFGYVSVLGVYSLYAKSFLPINILPATAIGLLSAAVLNLNNMRDYKNDEVSGKMTLVVKIGPNAAKLYHALLIIISLSSIAVYIGKIGYPILFIALIPFLGLLLHLRKVMQTTDPKDFDPELKKVALLTFAIALLFTLITFFIIPIQ